MENNRLKVSYRVSTKGGGWSKFNTIDGVIKYYKKLVSSGIDSTILKITKVTEELLSQEEIAKINMQIKR